YVRFHYKNPETEAPNQGTTETISKILDQATEMDPNLQELLNKFASYLNEQSQKGEG
ncbi:unnamed protein product, partial [marine sediment metagenome]